MLGSWRWKPRGISRLRIVEINCWTGILNSTVQLHRMRSLLAAWPSNLICELSVSACHEYLVSYSLLIKQLLYSLFCSYAYIYHQIRFHHAEAHYCGFALMVNNETRFKCIEGRSPPFSRPQPPGWRYTTCHVIGTTMLRTNDRVWLKDARGILSAAIGHYVDLIPDDHPAGTFWGLVRLWWHLYIFSRISYDAITFYLYFSARLKIAIYCTAWILSQCVILCCSFFEHWFEPIVDRKSDFTDDPTLV